MKNTRILWIVFLALLILFLLSRIFDRTDKRSFDRQIISVDTSRITQILIHPKTGEETIYLKKINSEWISESGDVQSPTPENIINSLLSELLSIEAKRMVGRGEDQWSEYQVTDEEGTRVEVFEGNKQVEKFYLGRFSFNQQTRTPISYIRRGDSRDVFAVEGFLGISFDQSFDNFRDKTVLNVNAVEITGLSYQRWGANFEITQETGSWNANGIPLDSMAVASYINGLSLVSAQSFYDEPWNGEAERSLSVKTKQGIQQVFASTSGFESPDFIIWRVEDPNIRFGSDSSGIFKKLFVDLDELLVN